MVLVVVAVLLGFGVGAMVREILEQRRREAEAEAATLRGRVKSQLRKGAQEVTKQAAKASRKGAWWMLKQRLRRKREDDDEAKED